jgi:hypothetical protein
LQIPQYVIDEKFAGAGLRHLSQALKQIICDTQLLVGILRIAVTDHKK